MNNPMQEILVELAISLLLIGLVAWFAFGGVKGCFGGFGG